MTLFGVNVLPLLQILAVLVVAWLITIVVQRYLALLADRLPARREAQVLSAIPVVSIAITLVAVLYGLFILLNNYKADSIVSLVGAAGLGIGLALNPLVAGIVAGVMAVYEGAYRTGDWVEIAGYYGRVESVGLRSLRMTTPDDTRVTIPHSRLWTDPIANANSGATDHLVVADFYLRPEHDARQVRETLRTVALTSAYTQLTRPVVVIVLEKPWGTHYRLKAYPITGRDEFPFISDLTVRGKAALKELGVKPALALPVAESEGREADAASPPLSLTGG